MTRGDEVWLKQQLGYLKGKVEVYEALLYSSGILKRPEIINFDEIRRRKDEKSNS